MIGGMKHKHIMKALESEPSICTSHSIKKIYNHHFSLQLVQILHSMVQYTNKSKKKISNTFIFNEHVHVSRSFLNKSLVSKKVKCMYTWYT